MEPKRIYIVDDHQLIIDGIKGMFAQHSEYSFVGSANDGIVAKEEIRLSAENIDVVITDVNLPGCSGIELCTYLKHQFPSIQVLIISMYSNQTIITEALKADADGYLLKTGGYQEFKQALSRILDGGSYYSESIYPIIWKEYQKEKEKDLLIQQLTARELEVLALIVRELTSSEIAERLFISKKTVDNHRQNLLQKTQSKSTIGLVKYAMKLGIQLDD